MLVSLSAAFSAIDGFLDAGVTVHSEVNSDKLTLSYHVQESYFNNIEDENQPAVITRWVALDPSGSIYSSNGEVDELTIGEPIELDGVKLVPVSFDPSGLDENVTTHVYELAINSSAPDFRNMSRAQWQMWDDFILNNSDLRRDPARDLPEHGPASYIYVVPDDRRVSELMEPLFELRKKQGYQVRELIVMNEDGRDIRDEIQTWHRVGPPVEYVCLVGDAGGQFSVPTLLRGSSDYPYGQLDGNDPYPEAAVGRLSYESLAQLEHLVNKILTYELEMEFDEPEWMLRGSVAAGNRISGRSTILVSRWVKDLMLDRGFTSVDTFWWNMGGSVANHMRRSFERGVAFVNYRGWTGLENWSPMEAVRLRNDDLPVALLLACNSGDYSNGDFSFSEALLRADGGAIGALASSGSQGRVNFNNALLAGFYRGVFDGEPVRLGWMINRAKLEMLSLYGQFAEEMAANHCYWTNLMGDPGTVIWTEIPQTATIEAPDQLDITEGEIVIQVLSEENEQPIENVRIGFYKPGEQGQDDHSVAAYTDDEGSAQISFEPRNMSGGTGFITISGTQVVPQTIEIELEAPANYISYADEYFIIDSEMMGDQYVGNGDQIPNPNEVIGLVVNMKNYGREALFVNTRYTLSSDADVVMIFQNNRLFERAIFPQEQFTVEFLIRLEPNFPDREPVPFTMDISTVDEQQEWSFEFNVTDGAAPRFEVVDIITEDDIRAGEFVRFDLILANMGQMDVGRTTVILESLSELVQVFQGDAVYDTLRAGRMQILDDPTFEIAIAEFAPEGAELPLQLICEPEDEPVLEGVAEFSLWLPAPQPTPLTGPDEYGYYALDDQDGMYNISPIFQWAELNPDRGGSGDRVDILDRGEDDDESMVINLPFRFNYYGEDYRQITICSNGWAAFGAQDAYVDFRNLPIGSPQGPRAQLCPWWDDLYQPNIDGEIFTFYDEIRHRFIIEWYKMKRYVGPAGPGAEQTFEIILLDPEWYPTYTGDGDIIFQYLNVTPEARVDWHGTPYATVGIGNTNDSGGLQYGFWNRFADGATPVRSQMAVRFSTASEHQYGIARGLILDDEDNPIDGATVRSSIGGWTATDNGGSFRIPSILAELPFQIIATAEGYNDGESEDEFEVAVGDSTDPITLRLTRPDIVVNTDSINIVLEDEVEFVYMISNQGTGTLIYEIDTAPAGHDDTLWDTLKTWNASEITDDNRILGVLYTHEVNSQFLVSGGNNGEDTNYLYRFDDDGNLIDPPFEQPCEGMWGLHDLGWDYDRDNLFGGCNDLIYEIERDGDLIGTIPSPIIPPRGLAIECNEEFQDPFFWVVNENSPIHRLDHDGNILRRYQHRLRPYGLAWHPDDIDGYPLYIFSADGETNLAISKMDTSTGEIYPVTELESQNGDFPGGCEFTKHWDSEHWTFTAVIQNREGDKIQLYNAGANLSWLDVSPAEGVIQPDRDNDMVVTFDVEGLSEVVYSADIVITHNGLGDEIRIPVRIILPWNSVESDFETPSTYTLAPVYPNPANSICRFNFELPATSDVTLNLYDQSGRLIDTLIEGSLSVGQHQHTVTLDGLPSGVYFVRLNSSTATLTQKFVLLK